MKWKFFYTLIFLISNHLVYSQCPTVEAGPDQTYCKDGKFITLSANVTNETVVQWTTSGSGAFFNASESSTEYVPTPTDYDNGSVKLTITASGVSCTPISDFVIITFIASPVVDVGEDRSICETFTGSAISASLTGATTGSWSTSGTGIISVPSAPNTYYQQSEADIANGSVVLTFTTDNTGNCLAQSDEFEFSIYPEPVVDLGSDLTIYEVPAEGIDLSAIITNPSDKTSYSITWVTNATGTIDNSILFSTKFHPSPSDISSGSVTISSQVSTMPFSGSCTAIDEKTITFEKITSILSSEQEVNELKAYPNPAREFVNIELKKQGAYTVSVINNEGRIVAEENSVSQNNQMKLSTEKLSPGIYFIKVIQDEQLYRAKFVKR